MRIVLLLPHAATSLHPVSLHGLQLAEGLVGAGHAVRLFAPRRRGVTEPPPPAWWPAILPLDALEMHVRHHPPDVIHTLGPPVPGGTDAARVRTLFRAPPTLPDDATVHLTPDPAVAHALQGFERPVRAIASGVRRPRRAPQGERSGPVLWAGRVAPGAGLARAIDAVRAARVPLRILAEPHDAEHLDQALRPRLGADLLLSSPRSPVDLIEALSAAPALLHVPDAPVPCCVAALRALACGTPVVGFDQGPLGALLQVPGAGRAVPPGDGAALAAALRHPPPAGAGPWQAAARFPLDRMVAEHLQAYADA